MDTVLKPHPFPCLAWFLRLIRWCNKHYSYSLACDEQNPQWVLDQLQVIKIGVFICQTTIIECLSREEQMELGKTAWSSCKKALELTRNRA